MKGVFVVLLNSFYVKLILFILVMIFLYVVAVTVPVPLFGLYLVASKRVKENEMFNHIEVLSLLLVFYVLILI